MALLYEVFARTGEYEQDGETRARWLKVGAVFETRAGKLALKLEAVPASKDWDGWLSLFEPKEREPEATGARPPAPRRPEPPRRRPPAAARADELNDEIPF